MTNYNDEMIVTVAEFAEMFGTEKCKEYFAKYKKLGGHKDSTITTAKQKWHIVEVVKIDKKNRYRLAGKREEEIERKQLQNYSNCGQDQMPYKEILQNLILIYLENPNRKPSATYRVLARDLEVMSDILFFASEKVTSDEQKAYYKNLDDKYKKNGYEMFWDAVNKETQRIRKHIESVLKDMKEKGIIRHMDVVNAVSLDKYEREIHNPINVSEVGKIDKMLKSLREKHEVTATDIRYKPKSTSVLSYKEDEYNYLQSFGYEYVYDAVYIDLIATDREIQNYMKDSLVTDFKKEHLAFAYQKALARENSFFNDIIRVKDNHKFHKLFGGKKKSEVLKGTLTAYDSILIDELLSDGIKQEKFGKTYATNYKESLKAIQDVLDVEENVNN
ncbi:hypothetical protein FH508_0017840 [Lysinibacillus sp. CD3-6]|uniref:hypothetical protein n=1 Tax=Lysinibacillus sp. CD3-6 TaxID=2892541 RepID=UPI00116FF7B4|nr:hypothetical protein [Lysinibacillus sp. CD3-6]UED79292.1 hypothetical protein FH508_0017840 [Lysinibacillus sp. CD3-6]